MIKKTNKLVKAIDKAENKYDKFAIKNLTFYIMACYVIGYFIDIISQNKGVDYYSDLFSLDFSMIFRGEVWRLFTFIWSVPGSTNIIFFIILLYVTYFIGNSLENSWGTFRYNLFIFSGLFFMIIGELIVYLIVGVDASGSEIWYLDHIMFIAFAILFPDIQFLLFWIIPVKCKYLAWIDIAYIVYDFGLYIFTGLNFIGSNDEEAMIAFAHAFVILASTLNIIIYYFGIVKSGNMKNRRRKKKYVKQIKAVSSDKKICEVCGKSQEEYPDMIFRYCSKCDGNHMYCSEHLFTHEHIKKFSINIDNDDL
jgi:hypothetical protein